MNRQTIIKAYQRGEITLDKSKLPLDERMMNLERKVQAQRGYFDLCGFCEFEERLGHCKLKGKVSDGPAMGGTVKYCDDFERDIYYYKLD